MLYLVILLASFGTCSAQAAFDEQFDQTGELRPASMRFVLRHGPEALDPKVERLDAFLNQPLGDRLSLFPKPVVLSDSDYYSIQIGGWQRARALLLFFADLAEIAGAPNRISEVMTLTQKFNFLATNPAYNMIALHAIYRGRSLNDVNFWHGADVIRAPSGRLVVMEDNVGSLGGLGDVKANHAVFNKTLGVGTTFEAPMVTAVRTFLSDLPSSRWSEVLVVKPKRDDSAFAYQSDRENERILAELGPLGLRIVSQEALHDFKDDITAGRVSRLITFYDVATMDIKEMLKDRILALFQSGKLKLFPSPGVDIVSSKALLPIMDKIIRVYTEAEPVLRTVPTSRVEKGVFKNSVYKHVLGGQGKNIYFASQLRPEERERLFLRIAESTAHLGLTVGAQPDAYVRQRFVDASYLPAGGPDSWVRFNVDYRPLVPVVGGVVMPRPVIWGRANTKFPGVLSNVSQGGFELVVTTPDLCERLLNPEIPFAPAEPEQLRLFE